MHLIYHVRIHIIYVSQNSYPLEKLLNKTLYPLITEASSIITGDILRRIYTNISLSEYYT
jgi:hypothetical protein